MRSLPSIIQLDTPCWVIVRAGEPVDEETPHYPTQAEAVADLDPDDPTTTAVTLDSPCWTATAACGYRFDEDARTFDTEHYADADDLRAAVLDSGWKPSAELGVLGCGRPDCRICNGLRQVLVPGPELPGQETLFPDPRPVTSITDVHLAVGPANHLGTPRIVCGAQAPTRRRTRIRERVTCPLCSIDTLVDAATAAADAAYHRRHLTGETS